MILRIRQKHRLPLRRFLVTLIGGILMGIISCVAYALTLHGQVMIGQIFLGGYFATGLLLILKGFDRLLWLASWRLLRIGSQPSWSSALRAGAAELILRAAVLFGLGLPFVLAAVLTYRAGRVAERGTPMTLFGWRFETDFEFRFPGQHQNRRVVDPVVPRAFQSNGSALPRIFRGKGQPIISGARGWLHGYNILSLDFRAHGESGGQQITFGDRERLDVLGAVRWLRATHPQACRRLLGLGVNTGDRLAPASRGADDQSRDGQSIDAVAVYNSYDRFDLLSQQTFDQYVPAPLNWLLKQIGVPLASLQVGINLDAFSPVNSAHDFGPAAAGDSWVAGPDHSV